MAVFAADVLDDFRPTIVGEIALVHGALRAFQNACRHRGAALVDVAAERRSLRELLSHHYALLAAKVAERSAETGEHYITRDRAEYQGMLRAAATGGAVLATWLSANTPKMSEAIALEVATALLLLGGLVLAFLAALPGLEPREAHQARVEAQGVEDGGQDVDVADRRRHHPAREEPRRVQDERDAQRRLRLTAPPRRQGRPRPEHRGSRCGSTAVRPRPA